MWGVNLADLPSATAAALTKQMLTDLTCTPNEKQLRGKKAPWKKVHSFCIGFVREGMLWLPPWYGRLAFPDAVPALGLTLGAAMSPNVAFTGTLREQPPQKQAAAQYMAWITKHRHTPSCILSLPCGYGKTVLCICIVTSLGRRTLILAHTNALVDQWQEEIRRFTSKDTRVGFVKEGGAIVFKDCDIIVASLASLLSHMRAGAPYLKDMLPSIGCVVLDEGHHAVATTFWEVLCNVPAGFRLVLTATPRRRDGLMNQLSWVTGPVVFRAERTTGAVHVVHIEFTGPGHEDLPMNLRHIMVKRLCFDASRTHLAVTIATRLVITQQRRVVIVTHLCEHVDILVAAATEELERAGVVPRVVSMFHAEPFRKPRRKPGATDQEDEEARLQALVAWEASGPHGVTKDVAAPLVGGVRATCSSHTRELAFEAHIVVATYTMLAEGVSYKQWDTLVDLANTPDCEQVVGRILRECPTKKVPLIVDFWMNMGSFGGAHWARQRYYSGEGFRQRSIRAGSASDIHWDMWDRYNVNVLDADKPGFVWPRAADGDGMADVGDDDDVTASGSASASAFAFDTTESDLWAW